MGNGMPSGRYEGSEKESMTVNTWVEIKSGGKSNPTGRITGNGGYICMFGEPQSSHGAATLLVDPDRLEEITMAGWLTRGISFLCRYGTCFLESPK